MGVLHPPTVLHPHGCCIFMALNQAAIRAFLVTLALRVSPCAPFTSARSPSFAL
jgi:hypothetical protein